MLACSTNVERTPSPAPGAKEFPVTINSPAKLDSIETGVLDPNGEPSRVSCATCHDVVDTGEAAVAPKDLKKFHVGLTFNHGNNECASCHSPTDPTKLRLATGKEVPTSDALLLCSQCHGTQKKSYDHGAHGGKNGHWDLSRGPQLRNHCVDCHDPHVPQIPSVMPAPRTRDRGNSPSAHPAGTH